MMKKCSQCEVYYDPKSMPPSYRGANCRACINLKAKLWRKRNRDHCRQYQTEYANRNLEKRLWAAAKRRSAQFGLPFNIEESDIVVPRQCPVLGIELVQCGGPLCNATPTVDKMVPELGYVKGNVHVISHLANRIKTNATLEQIEAIAEWMRKNRI